MSHQRMTQLALLMLLLLTFIQFSLHDQSHYDEEKKCWKCGDTCFVDTLICDGYEQCNDNSDEGKEPYQGCNLYPDSGCLSYGGKKHYRCERSGECFKKKSEADKCEISTGPPMRECELDDEWRCGDGRCVKKSRVCDG